MNDAHRVNGVASPTSTNGEATSYRLSHELRRLPLYLFPLDLIVLYVAFVSGVKVRLGTWTLWPAALDYDAALLIVVGIYATVLVISGLYRLSPRSMRTNDFVRVAASMVAAWALSIAALYLLTPTRIPPRSVTTIHCLLSILGVLGVRVLLRQALARQDDPSPHPFRLDDVVSRPSVQVNTRALRHYLSDRTVLVTGAGGSIGTELSNQLVSLEPFRLVLVDVSEYNLFQLENDLRKRRFDGELEFCIADVRDEAITGELFSQFRPDLVLHAAAYKHVPLMERHPIEAFRNNTLATVNLLQLSQRYEAEQFVFVSTDKAVEPTSVLGATKRLAEWYVRTADTPPKHKIVRFGNVFGSQGSVVPLFRKQLASEGVARVTHPEMERFFMSAEEACALILQTLLLDSAPIYTFDMGDPIRIRDLAAAMIQHMRPQTNPSEHIEYVGKRPGEKLAEKLLASDETAHPTDHPSILGLTGEIPCTRPALNRHLSRLEALCQQHHAAELRKALFETHFEPLLQEAQ